MVKIFIDPGHGGSDPGAGRNPYLEKTLVLNVANRLNQYLKTEFENVTVVQSRTTDRALSLAQRTNHANAERADYLMSIHFNAFNGTARGYEDFVHTSVSDGSASERIRTAIHNEVVNRVLRKYGIPNRGRKKANFHMVRESRMSAVLVECLFVDNTADQRLIVDNNWITDMVTALGEGIGKAFNLRRKTVPVSIPTPGRLYRVQCGAFSVRQNAEALEARLKRAGFPAFITQSRGLYRVQCGAFSNIQNARNLESNLRKSGFPVYIYSD